MFNLFLILLMISIILLVVGIIKPSISLKFLDKEMQTRKNVFKFFGIISLISFIGMMITVESPENNVKEMPEINNELGSQEIKKDEKKVEEQSIFLQEGNPVYGGNVIEAEEYAKKFKKGEVTFKNSGWTEESIIHIPLIIDDRIKSIELYPRSLSINDVKLFEIISAYLPKEIIEKDYKEPKFTKYVKEDNDSNANRLILYSPKENAENSLGTIYIVIHIENNNVRTIQFTSSRPNSVSTRGSSMVEEEWEPEHSLY